MGKKKDTGKSIEDPYYLLKGAGEPLRGLISEIIKCEQAFLHQKQPRVFPDILEKIRTVIN